MSSTKELIFEFHQLELAALYMNPYAGIKITILQYITTSSTRSLQ